jgi:hypothetical protein
MNRLVTFSKFAVGIIFGVRLMRKNTVLQELAAKDITQDTDLFSVTQDMSSSIKQSVQKKPLAKLILLQLMNNDTKNLGCQLSTSQALKHLKVNHQTQCQIL